MLSFLLNMCMLCRAITATKGSGTWSADGPQVGRARHRRGSSRGGHAPDDHSVVVGGGPRDQEDLHNVLHYCRRDHAAMETMLEGLGLDFDEEGDYCEWHDGIKCENGCVVEVNLNEDTVEVGHLPHEIPSDLCQQLRVVNITAPFLSGDIKVFASCTSLTHLILADTQVTGDIKVFEALSNLEVVGLQHTRVFGNIQVFQASRKLEELNLQSTHVSGDIQAFEATCKLKVLHLAATQVFGNIRAFEKTKELHQLDLSLTEAFGDIRAFNSTPALEDLDLMLTWVDGDISVFQHTEHLQFLALKSTNVKGDIQVFTFTKSLKYVMLGDTFIVGDICVFKSIDFAGLWCVEMEDTGIDGNISFLGGLPQLETLNLAKTQVWGDIEVFKHTKLLSRLQCHSTQIMGEVQVFREHLYLKSLDLSFTNVTGDAEVFSSKSGITTLKLASTGVSGEIGVLVSGTIHNTLMVLDLSSTKVVGNIWVFQHAKALNELYLANTQVTGSMDGILLWKYVKVIDLSHTMVHGRLTQRWRGCCRWLRSLKLSGSQVQFLPNGDDRANLKRLKDEDQVLLPALTTLEVSDCPLNGPAEDLFLPLSLCRNLGSVLAAGSGLTGELPTFDPLPPIECDGVISLNIRSPLETSLEVLDLSRNNLSYIAAIPAATHTLELSSNQQPLHVANSAVMKACKRGALIDLRGSTPTADLVKELKGMIEEGAVNQTSERIAFHADMGYRCYDLDRSSTHLVVTVSHFFPEWCTCLAGWHGSGINCEECDENTFNPNESALTCAQCPANTTSGRRKKSVHDCQCKAGALHEVDGEWICGCPKGKARDNDSCLPCQDLHLNCSSHLTAAESAEPLQGFARLKLNGTKAYKCLSRDRCPGANVSGLGCAPGYEGPLCMGCSETHFAAGSSCFECSGGRLPPWLFTAGLVVTLMALSVAGVVATAYFVYSWHPGKWVEDLLGPYRQVVFAKGILGTLQEKLLRNQVPILLQMGQLWVVLAVLSSNGEKEDPNASSQRFWELPYLQTVQFAIGNLRELLYLQCYLGGRAVRVALALITPVLPLILLLCCLGMEYFSPGSGVNAALKVLTVFFIGGASKCSALRSCQLFDAGGVKLEQFAFLRQLPDIWCDQNLPWSESSPEQKLVSSVFWPCAICYGILIPSFLFTLYARQHVVLRYSRVPLELHEGHQEETLAVGVQDKMQERRVVAAAVAYVAMLQEGSVKVQLRDGKGIVTCVEKPDRTTFELEVDAVSAHFKKESEKVRHHMITEMLLEHSILEEVGRNDRILQGAKETLFKYATFRDLWMEVVLKLVAVALVRVVSTAQVAQAANSSDEDLYFFLDFSLAKVLAITLTMAGTVWMVHPYAQPQVNDLQFCCFLGLSISAVGFSFQMAWLSRLGLLAPLLLAAGQAVQPDSPESLACRLWDKLTEPAKDGDNDLAEGMPAKAVEVEVLSRRQSVPVCFSLERPAAGGLPRRATHL
ncbi:unnamed protein product [Durusdinium trenchii]|uniref:Tyrosine-protein kinase ephrin type A/B receptor-like domain-containing protein n=1 Tax=Durusdinium trenchii TaxID=1381693 RepID=A0ABP0QS48_9DINO